MIFVMGFVLVVIGLILSKLREGGEKTFFVAVVLLMTGALNMTISLGILAWEYLP